MFGRLTTLACVRPFSTLAACAALVGLGLLSLFDLPVSLLPRFERPQVVVQLAAPGSGVDSIVDQFVEPVEPALLALPAVETLGVSIDHGAARFTIDSEWDADPNRLAIQVERIFAQAVDPAVASYRLEIASNDPDPVLQVAVLSADGPARTEFVRSVLAPELAQLEHAGRIELIGLEPLHAVIEPRPSELLARGLTVSDLLDALGTVGRDLPSGRVQVGARELPLLISNPVDSVAELEALPIRAAGVQVFLGDVAEVGLETVPTRGEFRIDGRRATSLELFRAPNANAVALARSAKRAIARLREQAGGMDIRIVDDRSEEVIAALGLLGATIGLSLLVAGAVLWFFHREWRTTLALIAVVPASLTISFCLFPLFDVSLNLISLSGLALSIGLLVDSSVVVLEAIGGRTAAGTAAVVEETTKVTPAIAASFLTTAVVFVPLAFLSGLTRTFFITQALVLTAALAIALLLSVTLTPVLAGRAATGAGRQTRPGFGLYRAVRDWGLERSGLLLALAVVVIAAAALAAAGTPRRLMPAERVRELEIAFRLAEGLSERRQDELLDGVERAVTGALAGKRVEQVLLSRPPRRDDDTRAGLDATMLVRLGDLADADAALAAVDAVLAERPALGASVRYRPGHLVGAVEQTALALEAVALGRTQQEADATARDLLAGLNQRLGLRLVSRANERSALAVSTRPGPAAASIPAPDLLQRSLADALTRRTVGRLDVAGVSAEIVVEPGAGGPQLAPLRLSDGSVAPLGVAAELRQVRQPPPSERFGGLWARTVELRPRDAIENQALYDAVAARYPPGERLVVQRGGAAETAEAARQTRLLLAVAVALVLLTVTAIFESFGAALLVALVVAVGQAGGILALWATAGTLDLVSALGLLLLAGLGANNAIVLIYAFQRRRAVVEDRLQAIREATVERYRPILITTATTVFAMLPLAVLGGSSSSLRRSLAVTIVGGMITSTLAALILVPSLLAGRRSRG